MQITPSAAETRGAACWCVYVCSRVQEQMQTVKLYMHTFYQSGNGLTHWVTG